MKQHTVALHVINGIAQQYKREPELKRKIYGWYFMYLFGGMRSDLFFERIQPYAPTGFRLDDVRQSIRNNGQLLRNVKVYVYSQYAKTLPRLSKGSLTWIPSSLGIGPVDTRIINQALQFRPLQVYLRGLLKQDFPVLSADEFTEKMHACLTSKDLNDYIGKFIYRKMSFIRNSSGEEPEEWFKDRVSDLQEAAIYNLLRTYPRWQNLGHMLATAKIAIHGRGINYIKEQVAQSRRQIAPGVNGGPAEHLRVSWEIIRETTSTIQSDTFNLYTEIDGKMNSEIDYDTRTSISQLLSANATLLPKQQKYLALLIGQFHEEFSLWLGESNSEAADRLRFDRYNEKVCAYMHIPIEAATTFLSSLRKHL